MIWFRSKVRFGARLALFALALQLALSFGHVHAEDLVPSATAATHATAAGQQSGAPTDPSAPAHRSDGADDICAVCALMQLVSTSVPAQAPVLAVPTRLAPIEHPTPAGAPWTAVPRPLFQARAPPTA